MELFRQYSPTSQNRQKNRSPPCIDGVLFLHIPESTSKFDYSDLVNKFITIPEDIFTVNFNMLEIDDTCILRNIVCFIFKTFFEKMDYNKINPLNLKTFVKDVCDKYNDVSYHNFYHATHIIHTTYVLLENCNLFDKLNTDIAFSILLSALVHDIGHPGNNNLYEINTCSELASRYNDLSVLEQYHCNLAFELIKKNNLFEHYTMDEFIICRKTIISSILGTDMANHKSILESIKHKKTHNFNFESLDDQYLLAKIFVHASDIGNPIQDYQNCEKWARKVSFEFHSQVEKEKDKGLKPFTSFNINSISSFYSHEIRYITYVCKPYWESLSDIFIPLKIYYDKICSNLLIYTEKLEDIEKQYDVNIEEY